MDLVSIIVPCYNVESYLDECIESIIKQTYKNIQIILVDDGSEDSTCEICEKWEQQDERIVLIKKENGGISSARNVGIKEAKGKYVCFIDSDDTIDKDYLERLYVKIKSENLDLVLCDFYDNISQKNNYKNQDIQTQIVSGIQLLKMLYNNAYLGTAWGKLGKKELYTEKTFPVGRKHEDVYAMLSICLQCKKVGIIKEKMYFYRQREHSIMAEKDFSLIKDDIFWLVHHINYYKHNGYTDLLYEARKLLCHNILKEWRNIPENQRKNIKKIYSLCYFNIIFSKNMKLKTKIKYITIGNPILMK